MTSTRRDAAPRSPVYRGIERLRSVILAILVAFAAPAALASEVVAPTAAAAAPAEEASPSTGAAPAPTALDAPAAPAADAHGARPVPEATAAPALPAAANSAASTAAPAAPALFERVGLIGASATAGFGVRVDALAPDGVSREIHGADLGDVLRAACRRPVVLSRYASWFFFNDPFRIGRDAVNGVLRFKPTCVIALDFLFWYGYGSQMPDGSRIRGEDDRLERLELGLAQLDRIVETGVPVIVGDFPDMHESVGRMLRPEQMPAEETLHRLNARLAEWASTRPNVRLLHLSSLAPALLRGDELEIRGRIWSRTTDGEFIQRDRLHPTFTGSIAMLAKACELVESCAPGTTASSEDAPPPAGACDETLCFEPAWVTERFLEQVRSGRRRSGDGTNAPANTATREAGAAARDGGRGDPGAGSRDGGRGARHRLDETRDETHRN